MLDIKNPSIRDVVYSFFYFEEGDFILKTFYVLSLPALFTTYKHNLHHQ